MERCSWCLKTDNMRNYHDEEWGVPVHDDRRHFEFITLDAFQAGLSWQTIINKRDNFRSAFDELNPEEIVRYDKERIEALLNDEGIIRNRLKIEATISNAEAFLEMQGKYGSFDSYIWKFTEGKTIVNKWSDIIQIPASTDLSDKISKDLKTHGFRFVGTTICYAYMQAAGIVNDHLVSCFRYSQLR